MDEEGAALGVVLQQAGAEEAPPRVGHVHVPAEQAPAHGGQPEGHGGVGHEAVRGAREAEGQPEGVLVAVGEGVDLAEQVARVHAADDRQGLGVPLAVQDELAGLELGPLPVQGGGQAEALVEGVLGEARDVGPEEGGGAEQVGGVPQDGVVGVQPEHLAEARVAEREGLHGEAARAAQVAELHVSQVAGHAGLDGAGDLVHVEPLDGQAADGSQALEPDVGVQGQAEPSRGGDEAAAHPAALVASVRGIRCTLRSPLATASRHRRRLTAAVPTRVTGRTETEICSRSVW